MEIIKSKEQKEERLKKSDQSLRDLGHHQAKQHIHWGNCRRKGERIFKKECIIDERHEYKLPINSMQSK